LNKNAEVFHLINDVLEWTMQALETKSRKSRIFNTDISTRK